ncbi:MAG: relaxase/mobilization nuclease domain-containing protein [Kineosporiaceae bacterium]
MPNVSRGKSVRGLIEYLAGPGRANEHRDPRVVAADPTVLAAVHDASDGSGYTSSGAVSLAGGAVRRAVARELERPGQAFGTNVAGGWVWHCSLSVRAGEGPLADATWAAVAERFVARMGFAGDGEKGPAPSRWVAVHHGASAAGNDHIHVVLGLVREDGTTASVWRDFVRAQRVCGELEREFGLQVLASRARGRGGRGVKRGEAEADARRGLPEPARYRLARMVRAAAVLADSEAEFVTLLRAEGLGVRPRWSADGKGTVVGYSVALAPVRGESPVWFGGGRLARDLALPRLRGRWADAGLDAAESSVAAWRPSSGRRRGRRPPAGSAQGVASASPAEVVAALEAARLELARIPVEERVLWARVASHVAGVLGAWSLQTEPAGDGPLARAEAAVAAAAQLHWDDGGGMGHPAWSAPAGPGLSRLQWACRQAVRRLDDRGVLRSMHRLGRVIARLSSDRSTAFPPTRDVLAAQQQRGRTSEPTPVPGTGR